MDKAHRHHTWQVSRQQQNANPNQIIEKDHLKESLV